MKRDFITILALMTALSSCNDDALFEKEMYKNVVALISSCLLYTSDAADE